MKKVKALAQTNELKKLGENNSYISELIRNDSIDEFIIYLNKNPNLLSTTIESSLIEYAAFYGSIQIFRYLFINGIELKPSLWLYTVHGRNLELIHFLEENHIDPPNKDYQKVLDE